MSVLCRFFTACVTWCLSALTSTMNTSVSLFSSVFFVADSVVRGNWMMAWWSGWFLLGALFQGYLGCLRSCGVFGGRKVGDVRVFFFSVAVDTFQFCLFAFKAFTLALALGGTGASFFTLGTVFMKNE